MLLLAHALLECHHCNTVRRRYFSELITFKELFEMVDSRDILAFLKDIGFYNRI